MYYKSYYRGQRQVIAPGSRVNLNSALKNENASHRFSGSAPRARPRRPRPEVPEARDNSLFSGACHWSGRQANIMVAVDKITGFAIWIRYMLSPAPGASSLVVWRIYQPFIPGQGVIGPGVGHAFHEGLVQDGRWHNLSLRTNSGYGYPYGVHRHQITGEDKEFKYRFEFWFDGNGSQHCEFVLANPWFPF